MQGFSYTLHTLEPLLAGSLGGDANSARSLRFVPGASVRGAAIEAWGNPMDAADTELRRLFLDGHTRYLNAYPRFPGNLRGLPTPLSWRRDKNQPSEDGGELIDLLAMTPDDNQELRRLDAEWCRLADDSVVTTRSRDYVNVHTQRDAERGRAGSGEGSVFRYEALAPGQLFAGAVLTDSRQDAATLKALFASLRFRIGKSRSAGYGLVEVIEVADLPSSWREAGNGKPSDTLQFSVTCLSDLLVRDERGHFTLDPVPALKRTLGLELTVQKQSQTGRPLVFRAATTVGGFNRKWNLPLPQVTAIAMGSVFVLSSPRPIHAALLEGLEDRGLGERVAEGYGRVVIDWYDYPPRVFSQEKADSQEPTHGTVTLSASEQRMLLTLMNRHRRIDLDRRLLDTISLHRIYGELANSQISRWRAVLQKSLAQNGPEEQLDQVRIFRAHEEEKNSRAWERMRRARVGDKQGQRLTDWIDEVLTAAEGPWKWFGPEKPVELQIAEGLKSEVGVALTAEYRLRLIDGVLARHARERAGDRQQGGMS